jgi:hypothetical protein
MAKKPSDRRNGLAEVERIKFLQKATRDSLSGAIALAIHNLGITETRNLLAKHRWQLAEFDPNE